MRCVCIVAASLLRWWRKSKYSACLLYLASVSVRWRGQVARRVWPQLQSWVLHNIYCNTLHAISRQYYSGQCISIPVNHGDDQPGVAPSLPPLPAPAPSDHPAGGQPLQEPQGAGVLHRGRDQGEDDCHVSRVTCNLSLVRAAWTRCWTQTISRRCFGTPEIARGVKMF